MPARECDADRSRPAPGRILRTLRELPKDRVFRRLTRSARGLPRRLAHAAGAGPGTVGPAEIGRTSPALSPSLTWTPPARFTLQGVTRDFGSEVDWALAPTRSWAYRLHALEGLREERSQDVRFRLLDDWTAANPFASRPGWEPYPTSLRIVNALELMLSSDPSSRVSRAGGIALQAWWLAANLEHDVGANHLLKNALALAWAGRALAGRSPDRWRAQGDALLLRELSKQILDDGFHVERSPGYHAVLVDDLIRLEHLLHAVGEGNGSFGKQVADARRRAASALASVLHPDGEIPLFNDATLDQAPPSAWILDRAASCDGGLRPTADPTGAPSAGFHRLAGDASLVLFDAGEVGFADQPAHAHADTLSFELSHGTTRIVVDAGVFDYEATPERSYARSTRSHNTLELDGVDQSEMWGIFRVGRRARPLDVSRRDLDGRAAIEASHDGYRHLRGAPVHRRRMEHLGRDAWLVEDVVSGGGRHRAVSRLRLHPALGNEVRTRDAIQVSDGSVVARIVAAGPSQLEVERGSYFPRFGEACDCLVVSFTAEGTLPLRITYRIELSTVSSP